MPQPRHSRRRFFAATIFFVIGAVIVSVLDLRRDDSPQTQPDRRARTSARSHVQPTDVNGRSASELAAGDAPRNAGGGGTAFYRVDAPIDGVRAHEVLPDRYHVPTTAEYARRLANVSSLDAGRMSSLRKGDVVALPLFDGREVRGRVNLVQTEAGGQTLIGGALEEDVRGSFSLGVGPAGFGGTVMPGDGEFVYIFEGGKNGVGTYLSEKERDHVVCVELPEAGSLPVEEGAAAPLEGPAEAGEFALSSRPTAPAVAYLDFDGETVTDTSWNSGSTIVATASGLTADQITETWRRVAEDYRAFNIDVTTNRSRYDAAPAKSRMRCIITQYSSWYGSAGGVAYVSSWRTAGSGGISSTIPCWVFADRLSNSARYISEAVSHEIGHTLGLSHDGLEDANGAMVTGYYSGHGSGSTSWAPIMGVGYYTNLVQWSKGEYVSGANVANNLEDDLAIISDPANHAGYVSDDAAGVAADAGALRMSDATTVNTIGEVARTGDADTFAFRAGVGTVSFTLVPEVTGGSGTGLANLDARAILHDAAGNVLADVNPTGSLFPNLTTTVAGGVYYLTISGVGEGVVNGTGYSNYGSLGRYQVTGTVPAAAAQAPAIVGLSQVTGSPGVGFVYQIDALGSPTSFGASGLPAGLTVNSTSGQIGGTPTVPGVFMVTLSATNAFGTGTKTLRIELSSALGAAVDAGAFSWSTGGNVAWTVDATTQHDGASSARSGAISHNGESWMEVSLTGPGTLSFWWRTSSQSNADYLRLRLDGSEQASISGSNSWAQRTLAIGSGTHLVRWAYTKNGSGSSGSDAGWVDGVAFVSAPVLNGAATARAIVGAPFSYQIVATNMPTSYAATGLPFGLSVNSATGEIGGTPSASAVPGIATVNLSATNAVGTGTQTLQIDVQSGFGAWTQDNALTGAAALLTADGDRDGVNNLVEYGLGMNPAVADNGAWPQISTINDLGTKRLELTFIRPLTRPDTVYTVEVSSNLVAWTTGHSYGPGTTNGGGLPTQEMERVSLGASGERIRVRDIGGTGTAPRFIRMRVTVQ